MSHRTLLYVFLLLLPGLTCAYHGGWTPRGVGRSLMNRTTRNWGYRPAQDTRCRPLQPAASYSERNRAASQQLRASPNEYDMFFNAASKSGNAVIRTLDVEERARRALEGEKLEDEIIEIATVLREKADEMVDKTGSINFQVIQPMIDEIQVLKSKYEVVVGATVPEDEGKATESEDTDEDETSRKDNA